MSIIPACSGLPISVVILTRNEEQDLPGCLDSLRWSDDIVVIDSYSTDQTRDVAKSYGARVVCSIFEGYSKQRNVGLSQDFKYPWVFMIDADERVTDDLVEGMRKFIINASDDVDGGQIRRRDIWWGSWLRHAQISPYYTRLMRCGRAHYEREINEVLVVQGSIVDVTGHLNHFPFSKGMSHWIDKHNRYARMEAELIVDRASIDPKLSVAFFGADFSEKRRHQKAFFYKMPFRPVIKFLYMMMVRRAFLDGWPGIRYALLQCIYEYFIVLFTIELLDKRK